MGQEKKFDAGLIFRKEHELTLLLFLCPHCMHVVLTNYFYGEYNNDECIVIRRGETGSHLSASKHQILNSNVGRKV